MLRDKHWLPLPVSSFITVAVLTQPTKLTPHMCSGLAVASGKTCAVDWQWQVVKHVQWTGSGKW